MQPHTVPIWSALRLLALYGVMLIAALVYFAGHTGRMPWTIAEMLGLAGGAALLLAMTLLLGFARASSRS